MLLLIYVYICMVLLTQGKSLLLIYIRVTSFILQLIHTNASTRATDMTDNITSSLLWFSFPKSLFLSVNLCLRVCSRQWIFWDEWDRNIKSQPTGLSSKHIQTWESYYCCSLHSSALFKNTSVCRNGMLLTLDIVCTCFYLQGREKKSTSAFVNNKRSIV